MKLAKRSPKNIGYAPAGLAFVLMALFATLPGCNARHDTEEQEVHAEIRPKPASVKAPASLRDTLQRLVQQLDTVRRIGCWDQDFARVMIVHHIGAQRLAAVEVSQGKDTVLRAQAQHVLKGHERDNHVLTLALTREPPAGREYQPDNAKDPFVQRMTAALVLLRSLPPSSGSIDTDFATLMVRHHKSGVALAQTELTLGRNDELRAAARNIVRDEQAEVKQYQHWLQAHATSLSPSNRIQ